jgi:hypothetical protein
LAHRIASAAATCGVAIDSEGNALLKSERPMAD